MSCSNYNYKSLVCTSTPQCASIFQSFSVVDLDLSRNRMIQFLSLKPNYFSFCLSVQLSR